MKRWQAIWIGSLAIFAAFGIGVDAGWTETIEVVDGVFRADKPFPQYESLWREGWNWKDDQGQRVRYADYRSLGGYVQLYVQNLSDRPLAIDDVLVQGVSLKEGVGSEPPNPKRKGKYASGISFAKLPQEQLDSLTHSGEPVWWKVDPNPVPPDGVGEITVRMRRTPGPKSLAVTVKAAETRVNHTIQVDRRVSRITGISFSPAMDQAFVYVQRPEGGESVPSRIKVDCEDRTSSSAFHTDSDIDTNLVVVNLTGPVREPSFHLFQVSMSDGSTATASIRAWEPIFRYGMWGIPKEGNSPDERARLYIERLAEHNINTLMSHYGNEVRGFVSKQEGRDLCAKLDMRIMDHSHGSFNDPLYFYLPDEPDAHDFGSKSIPEPQKRLGSLAMWVLEVGKELRQQDPDTLLLCNIDNTYKPEQWHMYAQLADVICADPYFPEQLRSVYRFDPNALGAYTKPTYVCAVGDIYGTAGAPKPMHLILHSCRFDMPEFPFRAPAPEEKRVEVYYSIATGAKGISYWWYTPSGRYYGCGGRSPDTEGMLTEIGLLGAEARSAGPLLVQAQPVDLQMRHPRKLWVRSLLAGPDSVVVFVVNDNIACDQAGFVSRDIENASVSVELPTWLKVADAFEINSAGTGDVGWKANGSKAEVDLGTVALTRMIVFTSDRGLRNTLQARYDSHFAGNVKRLLSTRKRLGEEAGK